jgi:hypothetical protein
MKKSSGFFKVAAVVVVSLGFMVVSGCKSNEDADGSGNAARQQLEKTVGYTVSTVIKVSGGIFGSALAIVTDIPGSNESTGESIDKVSSTSYNPNTGWWSFSISLEDGQGADVKIRFLDSSGNFYKYYSILINRIETTGEGSGSNGFFDWNFIITGVGIGSTSYIVNGTGTAKYGDTLCTYSVSDMKIIKSGDGIPESGSMTVTIGEVTFTVTFNGTESVVVTYHYLGMSYTVTINLKTGEVT